MIAELKVEPPEIRDPSLVPCSSFDVNITINNVKSLKTCAFNITYNSEVIIESGFQISPVLGQVPSKKILLDDEAGFIWVKLTYPESITTYSPVTIMTVMFHVKAMGISPINLTDTGMTGVYGRPIVHTVQHGIFIGLICDIAVTEHSVKLKFAYAGWAVEINVTVRNEGTTTETFYVVAYYDGNPIDTITVNDLSSGSETTITFVWETENVAPCHNYTISAEAKALPYEINLENNFLTDGKVKINIMGDVNGDSRVDMQDLNAVCNAFGAFPGHPRWNKNADLDQNKRMNLTDMGIATMNFGKPC